MKNRFRGIALAAALAMPPVAIAAAPAIELGDMAVLSGKVVAIDRASRTVAVQGPEGNVLVTSVDKAARNFAQVRVGDVVKLEYFESIALYISTDGKPPEADVAVVAARAAKGKKPSGEVVEVDDISATVQSIDAAKRVVMLKGPQGNVIPIKVDKSVKAFDQLKVGDAIHVRYTEAIALSVSKP